MSRPLCLLPPASPPRRICRGQSLLEFVQAKPDVKAAASPDRPSYAETDYPHRAFGWSALRALRSGKYLFIQAPEPELYNQANDPAEIHNLAGNSKAVTDTLASQLAGLRSKTSQTLVDLGKPDPEKLQKLQALGYVGSDTAPVQDEKQLTGADPKTRIEISNLLHDAMFDVEDARYEQAIPIAAACARGAA